MRPTLAILNALIDFHTKAAVGTDNCHYGIGCPAPVRVRRTARRVMDKAGRKIRAAFEGLQSLWNNNQHIDLQSVETLTPEDFAVSEIACHGFPYQPTCLAYDPVQKLIAIGTQCGAIRILGQPGVNVSIRHPNKSSVIQLQFIFNEGAVISLCSDCCIHMWNIRLKRPEIVHSLRFTREKLTLMYLPFQSNWLYLGTEKGNVHVVSIETFTLSGYVINWNKAIDMSQKHHPGTVVHLSECPSDDSKLLIGYECGTLVLWDLKDKSVDSRYQCMQRLRSACWHCDGKQFMCALSNGSLMTWTMKKTTEPTDLVIPLSKLDCKSFNSAAASGAGNTKLPEGETAGSQQRVQAAPSKQFYRPIDKVDWCTQRGSEDLVLFSGGTPFLNSERPPCITIMRGKSVSVLEMEHPVITFITLWDTPYITEEQDCSAVAVLLQNDLVAIDLKSEGCLCFENPYSMNIHDSPVTCCTYLSDCPIDLIRALYAIGSKQKKRGYTSKNWPLTGGVWSSSPSSDPELVITGHLDGSVKFWDFSSVSLQILYRLRTAKFFEIDESCVRTDLNLFSITHILLCAASRYLAVSGMAGHIVLFKFNRQESSAEVPVLQIQAFGSPLYHHVSPDKSPANTSNSAKTPPCCTNTSANFSSLDSDSCSSLAKPVSYYPVKAKTASTKRACGYQTDLICLNAWPSLSLPEAISAMALNSAYGLFAYGTDQGLVVVDILQKCCITVLETAELYGTGDATSLRSPKGGAALNEKIASFDISDNRQSSEKQDSATSFTRSNTASSENAQHSSKAYVKMASKSMSLAGKPPKPSPRERTKCSSDRESLDSPDMGFEEGVCYLEFIENSSRIEQLNGINLWVGTTYGTVIPVNIKLPEQEQRLDSPVQVTIAGITLTKQCGFILSIGFLDSQCNMLLPPVKFFKELDQENSLAKNRVLRRANTLVTSVDVEGMQSKSDTLDFSSSSSSSGTEKKEWNVAEQYIVICAERSSRVLSLSNLSTTLFNFKYDFPFVQASVITFNAKPIIAGCFSNGRIAAYSIPSLRPLIDVPFFPPNLHCLETVKFGHQGTGVYMCSPTELLKFAISAHFVQDSKDALGSLYLPCVMPQPPKTNFFKELFNINSRNTVDRKELFGESCGKPLKNVAQRIPMQTLSAEVSQKKVNTTNEVAKARLALHERGEKLSEVEDRTTALLDSTKSYADQMHEIMLKQKNKKWYQL
ncbi:Syntaxin-binding protein 5 [Trichinella pseudospiralis]|uniref:Syntaxin-binding protein 5 n=1 Tax=Trichinella pseudospiralis TaxID=6337 RepID=A0A0V1JKQ3_TRIPS|nr:Syntaxin-binding protein 5 [Trichinella pseudospiralis]KRZ35157.1 Syntaxin-binding protein 5 [Trichinella pseudospiralis]